MSFIPYIGKSEKLRCMLALICFLCAVFIQSQLISGTAELPQKQASSLFNLISDDTRMVISVAMMKKVDAYFHGGATAVNCAIEDAPAREPARARGGRAFHHV